MNKVGLFEKHCFLFAPDQIEMETKWKNKAQVYQDSAKEMLEAVYDRLTENEPSGALHDIIDLTFDSDDSGKR